MNFKNPILNELETLAPTLINLPRTIPYSLENGYFESLSTNILYKIKSENELSNSFSIDYIEKINPYSIPENYFLNLVDQILSKISTEKTILKESSILIVAENPYQVPDGYFRNLSNQISKKINLLEETENNFLNNLNKATPYQVPEGFFEKFSIKVLNEITNVDEFEISSLFIKSNPYKVPTNFFDTLASNLLNKIKEENELVTNGKAFSKANPYQVPVGYFESLSNEIFFKLNPPISQDVPNGYFDALPTVILQKIRGLEVERELLEIAPILNTINKAPLNHVPIGYFDQLAPVATQVQTTTPAKIIGLKRKTNWLKNAIAACLVGTLGFTAYQIMDSSASTGTVKTIQSFSQNGGNTVSIPTAGINVDEELSKVDDASLASYVNNIEMPTEQATTHFQAVSDGVDAALQNISDEALQQHLDETGELADKKN